jgi:8-oxo-dGTP diphosphatase
VDNRSITETHGTPLTVVAALIWQGKKLLVCQRRKTGSFPGKWEFPGGKAEPGESPAAALERELFEELGIHARIGKKVAEIDHRYPGRRPVHLVFFSVVAFEGVPENRVFEEIRWVEAADLGRYDFLEADRPLVVNIARNSSAANQRGELTEMEVQEDGGLD